VQSPADTTTNLNVGSFVPTKPPLLESFTTYLLYKPDGGVWVALSKLNWAWGIGVSVANGVGTLNQNQGMFTFDLKGTDISSEWPTWTGTTTTVLGNGWIAGP